MHTSAEPVPDELTVDVPEHGTGERSRLRKQRQRRRRLTTAAYAVTIVLLAASIPALGYAGVRAVLDNRRTGKVVQLPDRVRDPTLSEGAPIPENPTGLLLHVGVDGALASATLLALSSDEQGGSAVVLPVTTLVDDGGGGSVPLTAVHAGGGRQAAGAAVERLLDAQFDLVLELDDRLLTELVYSASGLRVDNPATASFAAPGGEPITFPEGGVDLTAADVSEFLQATGESDTVATRLSRAQEVWRSWVETVSANPNAAPGRPADREFATFLRGLAAGPVLYQVLPVAPDPTTAQGLVEFATDPLEVRLMAARLLPGALADPPPGSTRVRLLDGVDDTTRLLAAARLLVGSGAVLVLVGDSDRFVDRTEVTYYKAEQAEAAGRLAGALTVGTPALGAEDVEAFDVTVVVGSDFTVQDGAAVPPTTGSNPTG